MWREGNQCGGTGIRAVQRRRLDTETLLMEIKVDIAHYWGVFLGEDCLAVFKYKAEAVSYAEARAHYKLNVIEVERKS